MVLDQISLSALQHWHYCPRQCGLIHLEQVFDDNIHTLRGQAEHAKADQPGVETAKGRRVERALPLWHDELGLVGKSDVVEFWPGGLPYPVEYKHGSRHKAADIAACDDIQLAAQAMCLEAMTGKAVNEGAIFTQALNGGAWLKLRRCCVHKSCKPRRPSARCLPRLVCRHHWLQSKQPDDARRVPCWSAASPRRSVPRW